MMKTNLLDTCFAARRAKAIAQRETIYDLVKDPVLQSALAKLEREPSLDIKPDKPRNQVRPKVHFCRRAYHREVQMTRFMRSILEEVCEGSKATEEAVLGTTNEPNTNGLRKAFATACFRQNIEVGEIARVLRKSDPFVRRLIGIGERQKQ